MRHRALLVGNELCMKCGEMMETISHLVFLNVRILILVFFMMERLGFYNKRIKGIKGWFEFIKVIFQ